ncbi:MAG: thioredoxin domain-containing protein [Dehalococcoidia bacterium]|nr:thioredoxin domain-containing protein [Dehalococcoidia bacterium]
MLNRPNLADVGLKTVDYLLQRGQKGPLRHSYSFPDGETGTPALLADYAHLVIALVDAYDRAPSPRYLDEAKRLAEEMCDFFRDERGGGFFDSVEDPDAPEVRDKPISDNAVAIEALIRLFSYTHDEEYRNAAEEVLSAFVLAYREYGEAAACYALAVQVEVMVGGAPGGAGTRAMITAAANIPYPNTTIKYVDSDDDERMAEAGYWAGSEAQAYVCLGTLCLAPVSDPETLHQTVLEFLESGAQDTGSIIQTISDL